MSASDIHHTTGNPFSQGGLKSLEMPEIALFATDPTGIQVSPFCKNKKFIKALFR
jgi:hypothetical protein